MTMEHAHITTEPPPKFWQDNWSGFFVQIMGIVTKSFGIICIESELK